MKSLIYLLLSFLSIGSVFAIQSIGPDDSVYTQDEAKVATDKGGIREGTQQIVEGTEGVVNPGSLNFFRASQGVLGTLQYIMDWVLGLIGTIVLIYIILQTISGMIKGDMSSAYDSIKNSSFALIGIASSWFLISFVFYLIEYFTS